MRTTIAIAFLVLAGVAHGDERPQLRGHETPRATDLLRAETLAKKAESRLQRPGRRRSGWQQGGTGWESGPTPAPPTPKVTIQVRGGGKSR
jgi:hypothetical protein